METKSAEENHNNNPYKLLDLIPTANNREWALYKNTNSTSNKSHQRSVENNLELRLGLSLPGGQEETATQEDQKKKWLMNIDKNKTPVVERDGDFNHALNYHHHSQSLVTHCYSDSCHNNKPIPGQDHNSQRHQARSFPAAVPWAGLTAGHLKDGSTQQLLCNSSMIMGSSDERADMNNRAGGFRPPPPPPPPPSRTGPSPQAPANNDTSTTAALPPSNSSQKRAASGSVVGWPPIRSFRKNLASSSNTNNNNTKQADSNQNGYHPSSSSRPAAIEKMKKPSETYKGQFVKINMDGVAIGRKVDLTMFDNYEKLSSSVDNLFRGLLAAQSGVGIHDKVGEDGQSGKPITGLLDGNGEYTLVYEDNEGDRMLVGDVPWHMFLSTVKRLRVLKTSEWLKLSKGNDSSKEGKKVASES